MLTIEAKVFLEILISGIERSVLLWENGPKLHGLSEIRGGVRNCKITVTSMQCCGSDPNLPDHMFLGLPDPDQLVRGMNPDPALDPDPSIIVQK